MYYSLFKHVIPSAWYAVFGIRIPRVIQTRGILRDFKCVHEMKIILLNKMYNVKEPLNHKY